MMKSTLYTILVGLLAVAGCSERIAPLDSRGAGQVLDLAVSIDQGVSKAPIVGTGFRDGTHLFGLAITKADGVTAYEVGSAHTWAEVVVAGANQTWTYKWGAMADAVSVLPLLYGGDPIQVAGYYPYNAGAVVDAARDGGRLNVPFDLTASGRSGQTDVMYSGTQDIGYASGARQSVTLSFRHFYALLEFQVKLKSAGEVASITKVEVCNKVGSDFLKHSGWFSPYTGALTASENGDVSVTVDELLSDMVYETIQVLVPPTLLTGYADGDIYVQMYDNGVADPKQFPILRSYLTQTGLYGFAGGGKYGFKLLYDNTASGSITVTEWNRTTVPDEVLGSSDPATLMVYGTEPFAAVGSLVGSTTSSYNSYTGTVADGTNGAMQASTGAAFRDEQPFYRLEVALFEHQSLTWAQAYNKCANELTSGGGWRLPRLSELYWIYQNKVALAAVPGFAAFSSGNAWSKTEQSSTAAWQVNFSSGVVSPNGKISNAHVRCVRER